MALVSQTFELSPFTVVDMRAVGDLTIEAPEPGAMPSLTVETAEAILPKLRNEVKDGRLVLTFDLMWWEWITWWFKWMTLSDKKVRYTLKATGVSEIKLAGSGTVAADGLTADHLALKITGSGKIRLGDIQAGQLSARVSGSGDFSLAGKVEQQEINISGSGNVEAAELESNRTYITISGSGSTKVKAKKELSVKINGAGRVSYFGEPQTFNQRVSGSGRIEKLG
ncbi:MAG TPA: head GIN domain-containing protein [Thermoleophilia bacterium]|jgi:carbon monoxide dehydrogenase subunit G